MPLSFEWRITINCPRIIIKFMEINGQLHGNYMLKINTLRLRLRRLPKNYHVDFVELKLPPAPEACRRMPHVDFVELKLPLAPEACRRITINYLSFRFHRTHVKYAFRVQIYIDLLRSAVPFVCHLCAICAERPFLSGFACHRCCIVVSFFVPLQRKR